MLGLQVSKSTKQVLVITDLLGLKGLSRISPHERPYPHQSPPVCARGCRTKQSCSSIWVKLVDTLLTADSNAALA